MASTHNSAVELMDAVPTGVRGRIVSGMRWTFWLSAIAVPFSYATSILLARVGPEVIGTYGLLMVYISIVASLFYFGGDSVVIRFLPLLQSEKQLSFLVSYFVVILLFIFICVGGVAFWPRSLHYLFGDHGGDRFLIGMLCLSPLYVVFSLVVAAHKAALDMRSAHLMTRFLTIGSFFIYVVLYVWDYNFIVAHYTGLIWGTYLLFTATAAGFGLRHIFEIKEWHRGWQSISFFFPPTFWHYTLTTEQVSIVAFFLGRFDLILIINLGGLALLGQYVAIVTIAESIRTANRFFADTLLPSLTNIIASGDVLAASQVVSMNLRILFVVNLIAMAVLTLSLDLMLRLFGPHYSPFRSLFIVAIVFSGLASPGTIGGNLLSSIGKQQRAFWVYLVQLVMFVLLFTALWSKWQLTGAVCAAGGSALFASLTVLLVAQKSMPFGFAVWREYIVFLCVAVVPAAAISLRTVPLSGGITLWTGAMCLFAVLGRYSIREGKELIRCFVTA